jgi:hypothetical protein
VVVVVVVVVVVEVDVVVASLGAPAGSGVVVDAPLARSSSVDGGVSAGGSVAESTSVDRRAAVLTGAGVGAGVPAVRSVG